MDVITMWKLRTTGNLIVCSNQNQNTWIIWMWHFIWVLSPARISYDVFLFHSGNSSVIETKCQAEITHSKYLQFLERAYPHWYKWIHPFTSIDPLNSNYFHVQLNWSGYWFSYQSTRNSILGNYLSWHKIKLYRGVFYAKWNILSVIQWPQKYTIWKL